MCLLAAMLSIPQTSVGRSNKSGGRISLLGWNKFIKLAHERALFWHKISVDCERPRHGKLPIVCVKHEQPTVRPKLYDYDALKEIRHGRKTAYC